MMELIAPAIVAAVVVYAVFRAIYLSKKDKKAALAALDAEPQEPTAVGAVVLGKQAGGFYSGSTKTARYQTEHYVKFLTDGGIEAVYSVPAETYPELFEGRRGTLVTVGEKFIDFGDGREIE